MSDPYDLQRFVDAQKDIYAQACSELRGGEKKGHWMWYIFPQLEGLGGSWMASKYGISSRKEAEEYLRHPVLGSRLRECTELVNAVQGRSVDEIFGYPDKLKFRSCMTLFSQVTDDNAIYWDALNKYYGGRSDQLTLDRLR